MMSACRGGWLWHGQLQGGGLLWLRPPANGQPGPTCGQTAGATAQGWPAAARSPQGATDYGHDVHRKASCGQRHCLQGLLPARVVARRSGARGGASHRGACPLAGWLLAGKGSRLLRWGSGGAVRVRKDG
ncbi:hypothetical protein B296_00021774 [Ensete ventricosum]|uniref:Uncharacterized protein n=1 Tax=Ensete ventricosum TaxID=4639 RepID=A0A426Z1R3_ENSVE|nr:hypothetical protein B296_00021774 [Ensete ventricosum]